VEVVIELAFIYELGMFGIDAFSLDGNLEVGLGVDGLVDFPEGPFSDFLDDLEVLTNFLQFLHFGKLIIERRCSFN
jgi:hypothetical protein